MNRQGTLNHLTQRLCERNLLFTPQELISLAGQFANTSANVALVIGRANFSTILLICRDGFPVTIFEREEDNPNINSLRVDEIVDLT